MPKPQKDDWPFLFHWAPRERRPQIVRHGLRPGMWSRDRLWRPPHVCLAPSPHVGWVLSGRNAPQIPEWDLWEVWTGSIRAWEVLTFDGSPSGHVSEFRVFERIYKRSLTLVATRTQELAERAPGR